MKKEWDFRMDRLGKREEAMAHAKGAASATRCATSMAHAKGVTCATCMEHAKGAKGAKGAKCVEFAAVAIMVVLLCAGLALAAGKGLSRDAIRIEDGAFVAGEQRWNQFLSGAEMEDGVVVTVSTSPVEQWADVVVYDAHIYYDAARGLYRYEDTQGRTMEGAYLMDVSGFAPVSGVPGRLVGIADQEYTYEELFGTIFGRNDGGDYKPDQAKVAFFLSAV